MAYYIVEGFLLMLGALFYTVSTSIMKDQVSEY